MNTPRFPNLFLIGAPKCGTTSLYNWLGAHPDVMAPEAKEPKFYYNPFGHRWEEAQYLANFEQSPKRYWLDGGVFNLYSDDALVGIKAHAPGAKIIVCLRNPSELVPAFHAQMVFNAMELEENLTKAWALSDIREAGEAVAIHFAEPGGDPAYCSLRNAGAIGDRVNELMEHFDRAAVHFVLLDDLRDTPQEVYRLLCAFLGLSDNVRPDFAVANAATSLRSGRLKRVLNFAARVKSAFGFKKSTGVFTSLHRANTISKKYAPPEESLRAEMKTVFSGQIDLLEEHTGRDLSHWR